MRSYSLLYSKIWKLVVSMIAVPVITIIPFILIASQYKNLTDTVMYIVIFIFLTLMILLTLFVVLKQAQVPVDVMIVADGLELYFKRKTFFYPLRKRKIFYSELETIINDTNFGYTAPKFIGLKLKKEIGKIILTAPRKRQEELESFLTQFGTVLEQYNIKNEE